MHGEAVEWGLAEMLVAKAIDALHAANWQRQGKKGAPRPKPIEIPGLVKKPGERTYGKGRGYTPTQLDAIFARNVDRNEVTDGS